MPEEKTPIEKEIEKIWETMRDKPELKTVGVELIKKLKLNAQGMATKDEVASAGKIFEAAVAALNSDE